MVESHTRGETNTRQEVKLTLTNANPALSQSDSPINHSLFITGVLSTWYVCDWRSSSIEELPKKARASSTTRFTIEVAPIVLWDSELEELCIFLSRKKSCFRQNIGMPTLGLLRRRRSKHVVDEAEIHDGCSSFSRRTPSQLEIKMLGKCSWLYVYRSLHRLPYLILAIFMTT